MLTTVMFNKVASNKSTQAPAAKSFNDIMEKMRESITSGNYQNQVTDFGGKKRKELEV